MKKPIRSICSKKFFLSLSLITALSACGGGGGGSKPDTKSSSTQSISSTATNISSSNTTLSAANNSTTSSKSLSSTPAPASSSSSVSFESGAKPNAFSFTAVNDVKANATFTSNSITVTGITKTILISITGGEYAIDSGAYTSASGTISNNQTVTVRVKSAAASKTLNSATLNLGGLTGSFDVTTLEDTAAPTAQIMFPTPVSLTEGTSILVRGIASDNANDIETLTVNGVAATTSDSYANWQAEVPLNAGTNSLVVSVTDASNNLAASAATANIKSGPLSENRTSDSDYVLGDPVGISFDETRNLLLVVDEDSISIFRWKIIKIDLDSSIPTYLTSYLSSNGGFGGIVVDGETNRLLALNRDAMFAADLNTYDMSFFLDHPNQNSEIDFDFPTAMSIDKERRRTLVADNGSRTILAVNIDTGIRTIFSNSTTPDTKDAFVNPYGIVVDEERNRALVTDQVPNNPSVLAVDLSTGTRSLLSTNIKPNINNPLYEPTAIAIDSKRTRALVADGDKIIAMDLISGDRTVISGTSIPDTVNPIPGINAIVVDDNHGIAFIAPRRYVGMIYALDLSTGKRVVFSK